MAIRYECRDCKRTVTGSAYRATCPRCGGMLVNVRRREKVS
ncbi:MAG TPA: rubrerythrin-like domain-containing protein [Halobacteriales archaeon]|nr:rubrerythrin-like domain-containing protein [Halobacteriales archaeon]